MDKERYVFIVYMISLLLTLFIAALDIVIVVTLYETIGIKFNDFGNVSWLVTGYDLSNAIFMLSWGRVASLIGVKESLLISIIIFEVGSLISALSNSLGVLIGGRVIAGFGGSGIESLVFVAGTSYVEEKYRGLTTSLLALSYVIAEGSGPFIGGLLTEKVSWRWCFYINLPIGAAAFAILLLCSDSFQLASRGRCQTFWRVVRKYNYGKLLKSTYWKQIGITIVCELDILGILLSSSGFTLLMLGLSFGGNKFSWNSPVVLSFLIGGPSILLLFCVYEFCYVPRMPLFFNVRRVRPLLQWNTVSNPGILTSSMTGFFSCFSYGLHTVYLVQFYQLVFNKGPMLASVHLWEFSVPAIIASFMMAGFNSKYGIIKPVVIFGVIVGVIGSGLLTLINGEITLGQSIGYSFLPGFAFGCIFQTTLLSSQLQICSDDPDYKNQFIEITAFNSFAKSLGFALGGNVGTMIFTTSIQNLAKSSASSIPNFSTIEELLAYRKDHFDGSESPLALIMTESIRNVFFCALGCYAASFIFGIFTSNKKTSTSVKKHQ